jgi:hypothetical protein
MCDPISLSIASLAIGVTSAGAGFVQQGQQAKANRKAAQENYAQQSEAIKTQ